MPLHFNSFNNEMSSSSLDVRLLTTTLYILGGEHMVEGKREPVLGYRLIQEINYIPF